jgi:hypothetical protein
VYASSRSPSDAAGSTARSSLTDLDTGIGDPGDRQPLWRDHQRPRRRLLNNSLCTHGVSSEKGWLGAKGAAAALTQVHAHFNGQDHRLIEINVDHYPHPKNARAIL